MRLFNDAQGIEWTDPACRGKYVLEFCPEPLQEADYFLNLRPIWKEVTGTVYEFETGKGRIEIPSGFYVMIGDVYGVLDWVMVDEMIGRPIDVVILNPEMDQWSLRPLDLVGASEQVVYWPQTRNVLPVQREENVLILSDKDFHHKTRDMLVTEFTVT